jgi:hypothetical protein
MSWLSLNAIHHSHPYVYDSPSFLHLRQVFGEYQLVWSLHSLKTWIHIVAPPFYRFMWMPSCRVTDHRWASAVNVWRKGIWNDCGKITFIRSFVYMRKKDNSGSTLNYLCIPFINPCSTALIPAIFKHLEGMKKYMHQLCLHILGGKGTVTRCSNLDHYVIITKLLDPILNIWRQLKSPYWRSHWTTRLFLL